MRKLQPVPRIALGFCLLVILLLSTSVLAESPEDYITGRFPDENGNIIEEVIVPGRPPADHREPSVTVPEPNLERGINVLGNVPAFDWCYGCSATSASMIAGYYDRTGYEDMYNGPTNGGIMPMNNSSWGSGECPLSATHRGYDGLSSRGHVDDYWYSYGSDNDPYYGNWSEHGYEDCTADYMGTNQYHNWQCSDGSTTFYYYPSGNPLYNYTGCEPDKRDGCRGFRLFLESRGYTFQSNGNFNQYIYGYGGNTNGFTFDEFQDEIDAGRPVIIHVTGHSMVGYGYNTTGNIIYIHDTWDHNNHSMTWGGSYSGHDHIGVSVFRLNPPSEPHPPEIERVNPSSSTTSIEEGSSINFVVNVSDEDGDLDEIRWYVNGSMIISEGLSGYSDTCNFVRTFNSTGNSTVTARVYDEEGETDELSWTVQVAPANVAPEIEREFPTESSVTLEQWESVNFQVSATDDDGNLEEFRWYLNGSSQQTSSASGSSSSDSWLHEFNTTGSNSVQVYIYDDEGLSDNLTWSVQVNSSSGEEIIDVTAPEAATTWTHYQTDSYAEWNYPSILAYDSVKVDIYKGGAFLDSYLSWTVNDGCETRVEPIPSSWGSGSNYQIRVEDNNGNYGWSEYFTIEPSEYQEVITVTEPNASSVWTHFQTNLPVNWEYPAILGSISTMHALSGETVTVALYNGTSIVETLATDIDNNGSWTMTDPVPMEWDPGTGYWIKITDDLGNYGWSEYFTIEPSAYQEVITVTEPNASSVWTHFQTNLPVNWEYPAILGSISTMHALSGETVTVALYNETSIVETLATDIDNNGSWTMTDPVPMEWDPGTGYRVKITDDLGNYGWSEYFTIEPSEYQEVITVTEPNASSSWTHFQTDLLVNWEYPAILGSISTMHALSGETVTVALYNETSIVETLATDIDNNGSWTMTDPVPMEWDPGTGYRIKITDDLGNYGWSEYFTIEPSEYQEVISIVEPDSNTIWLQLETDLPIQWSYQAQVGRTASARTLSGTTVSIALYSDSTTCISIIATDIENTGSWVMEDPVPETWLPDSTYQIRIEDDLGNYGWSEYFCIKPPEDTENSNEEFIGTTLYALSPNPVSGLFSVNFSIAASSRVNINIYDLCGRNILTASNRTFDSGSHSIVIDSMKPGIYFCRMTTENYSSIQRFMVVE